MNDSTCRLAVIGAGPVGLALALHAAAALPRAEISLFDTRPIDKDVSGDPRTIAVSLGTVQLLERLGAWRAELAQPILEVHVSQQAPSLAALASRWLPEPALRIRAIDEAVTMLGAVLAYGSVVAPLQAMWVEAQMREPHRLHTRFGQPVTALKNVGPSGDSRSIDVAGVEVDAGIAERFDLAVIAEGGVFNDPTRRELQHERKTIGHDYAQTAWVGKVTFDHGGAGQPPTRGGAASEQPSTNGRATRQAAAAPTGALGRTDDARASESTRYRPAGNLAIAEPRRGVAFERFTRHGPAALLPLPDGTAGLVWCVPSNDDPVRDLDATQRAAVLNTIFHPDVGRIATVSPLKHFALGLTAERTLTDGRTVRIGNAAQTLHPVAGQGMNLGMRDAFELVRALERSSDITAVLRKLEWQRAPDRWAMIAATDFLARSFTWKLPGAGAARGLGIAALQAIGPLKSMLARQMMFGSR